MRCSIKLDFRRLEEFLWLFLDSTVPLIKKNISVSLMSHTFFTTQILKEVFIITLSVFSTVNQGNSPNEERRFDFNLYFSTSVISLICSQWLVSHNWLETPAAKGGRYCHNSFGSMLAWLKNFNWSRSEQVWGFVFFPLSLPVICIMSVCISDCCKCLLEPSNWRVCIGNY